MVGMRDVARKAGVSVSTVSLVVNGTGYVSAAMRAKVEAAMHALNYVPNELARNLYHDRTNVVGVIVPTIRHPFFATLTAGLQGRLFDAGFRTIVCSTADMGGGEEQYVDMLRRHMMDGLIMGGHTAHPTNYWTSIQRPVVAFDRYLGASIPSIGSDHEQGGELAATMFALSGVRHVVEIGGPRSQYNDLLTAQMAAAQADVASDAAAEGESAPVPASASEAVSLSGRSVQDVIGDHSTFPPIRYHLAFEQTLDMAGIRWDYLEVPEVSDFAGYEAAARRAFDRFPEADAIVAPDMAAAFCVQEALRRGVRVPDQMQIMAYDGTYVTDLAGMRITSILQDFEALADAAARRMIDAIAGAEAQEMQEKHVTGGAGAGVGGGADAGSEGEGEVASGRGTRTGDGRDDAPVPAKPAGVVADMVPMQVKLGETTRMTDAVHQLLFGAEAAQTD
ncbi:LacI family transcriptional regulator [Bifidobacterium sp. DSM 109958]|uniref:LacI family transcriptional regulator n=1 Tax=Bifidobacterium moraviense TaxID=2675323 RepID=A0A7Y0F2E3_9BIFI|nr:LacI family DNA-binding transcriptional regulator [Bifidobacterium sp. DSM 109958]NMN00800.1 LacI family transcriptional regulator [Bifidobacterium sp. DSM 109958]